MERQKMNELETFLFNEPFGSDNKTLFRNRASLCRELILLRKGVEENDLASLKAQLSQWLKRGDEENSRPIPQDTLEEIQILIAGILKEDRVDPPEIVKQKFLKAYRETKNPNSLLDISLLFSDFFEKIKGAKRIFATLTNFSNLSNNNLGREFIQLLQELAFPPSHGYDPEKNGSIVFNEMYQFWRFSSKYAHELKNTNDHANLKFYINKQGLAFYDVVLLDLQSDNGMGYLLIDTQPMVPIRTHAAKFDTLLNSVYIPLKAQSERISWDYLNHF